MPGGIATVGVLKGLLSSENSLVGILQEEGSLAGGLVHYSKCTHKKYEGPYSADPSFETQTLETRGKIMADDVSVTPISVSRVTNLSGGITVFIGGIINA